MFTFCPPTKSPSTQIKKIIFDYFSEDGSTLKIDLKYISYLLRVHKKNSKRGHFL